MRYLPKVASSGTPFEFIIDAAGLFALAETSLASPDWADASAAVFLFGWRGAAEDSSRLALPRTRHILGCPVFAIGGCVPMQREKKQKQTFKVSWSLRGVLAIWWIGGPGVDRLDRGSHARRARAGSCLRKSQGAAV